jgi:hypothetical protein
MVLLYSTGASEDVLRALPSLIPEEGETIAEINGRAL